METPLQAGTANDFLLQALNRRREEGLLRNLQTENGLIDFCSNDYLGLARSEDLLCMAEKEWSQLLHKKSGSGGSRLLAGNTAYAEALEKEIAQFHRAGSALIFNSGYDANVGLFSCVPRRNDTILYDELIHASVRDGVRLSPAKGFNFRHNDMAHLESRLQKAEGTCFVAVESVYSMDGDYCPLKEIAELCSRYKALLIVDEAHATGVTGEKGEGLSAALGLENEIFARLHTFGKALGCHGAAVLGSPALREYLVNFARSFIYTTALPLQSLVSIRCAYRFFPAMHQERKKLAGLVDLFRSASGEAELELTPSDGPIQCILQSGNTRARELAGKAREQGFDVRPILSPTVPEGTERIRVCLHAFNTPGEVSGLIDSFS